jgi:hypothetical protein
MVDRRERPVADCREAEVRRDHQLGDAAAVGPMESVAAALARARRGSGSEIMQRAVGVAHEAARLRAQLDRSSWSRLVGAAPSTDQ